MGRGRLRRGCSLEVIFEEDPDFCSHLDSLDGGVAIRFGIKEPDDTISLDSLLEVEEYQVRFQDPADAEQVFRSLDGFVNIRNMDDFMVEWDEFSMDSNSGKTEEESRDGTDEQNHLPENNDSSTTNNTEKVPSGRRSRVSRRQIIQATWLGYNSSSDESVSNNDLDDTDAKLVGSKSYKSSSAPCKPPRRRSPSSRYIKAKEANKEATIFELHSEETCEPSCSSVSNNGADMTTLESTTDISVEESEAQPCASSSKTILADSSDSRPNLVTSVEDFLEESDQKEEETTIGLKSRSELSIETFPNTVCIGDVGPHFIAPSCSHAEEIGSEHLGVFTRCEPHELMEKDTLDSYISTMTDETDTNAYTFADPFDDTHSVASTSYESSGSTSSSESNGSVCTVNSFTTQTRKSKSDSTSISNTDTDARANSPTKGYTNEYSSRTKYKSNLTKELVCELNESHASGSTAATEISNIPKQSAYSPSTVSGASAEPSLSSPSHSQRQPRFKPVIHQQSFLNTEQHVATGEVKRVRALFELRNHSRSSSNGNDRSGSSSNGSTCPSSPESMTRRSVSSRNDGEISPCGSTTRTGLFSKNGRSRASPARAASSASPSKLSRCTSYGTGSSIAQNPVLEGIVAGPNSPGGGSHQSSYDYVDILVNENVVIEDAPDIYQTLRSRRTCNFDRNAIPSPPITNKRPVTLLNLSPRDIGVAVKEGPLRRSQSMGTGISNIGGSSLPTGILRESSSKSNILAEELPAPDTVKNVRNVFENMLKMRGEKHGSENSVDMTGSQSGEFSGPFSIVKKSISYIKSNPTSKIYRSESMRDDFPSMGRRFGKPILMNETNAPVQSSNYSSFVTPTTTVTDKATTTGDSSVNIKGRCARTSTALAVLGDVVDSSGRSTLGRRSSSASPMNKNQIERKISEPGKFSLKINTGLSPSSVPNMLRTSCQVPLTEEDPSYASNLSGRESDDYSSRKYVHPDVLNKIRSAGTTTTYFGGKIVAKTVKNRKIPVSRRHTFDFQDYVGISGEGSSLTNNYDSNSSHPYFREDESEDKFSACPGSSAGCNSVYGRPSSSRPALDIPLKQSSSSSIYASHSTTISDALDSIFSSGVGGLLTFASKPIDTTPRIISVLHKSPPGSHTGSPVKSCSPVSSVIEEGRNSPEGCEDTNEKTAIEQDGNNNNLPGKVNTSSAAQSPRGDDRRGVYDSKFSQITEGAWF